MQVNKLKNNQTFLGIVIALLIIVGVVYAIFIRPSSYILTGGEAELVPVKTFHITDDYVSLAVINGYIYECNKNGLIKKDLNDQIVWSKSYFMDSPLMVHSGSYIAVADITGKSVYVFNEKGFLHETKESNQIVDIDINQEGFLTTVQESGKQNYIFYYNNEGSRLIKRATRFVEDGYPIDVTTSYDVQKMMTGYLNVSNHRLQTYISFFGFADQYDDYDEKIIGGFIYEDALLNKVVWMKDDRTLAVMDNGIVIYNCKEEPTVEATIPVLAELKDVQITENEIIVQYGRAIEVGGEELEGKVLVYNHQGKLKNTLSFDNPVQIVRASKDAFFVITGSMIIKYKGNSREWFSSTYLTVDDFYMVKKDEYLVVGTNGYELLKIKER